MPVAEHIQALACVFYVFVCLSRFLIQASSCYFFEVKRPWKPQCLHSIFLPVSTNDLILHFPFTLGFTAL